MNWVDVVRERIVPVTGGVDIAGPGLGATLAVVLALVLVRPAWLVVRLAVTLVHELGHAVVGLAVGRRFVGFVVRGDMSGHAVTAGPPRGLGRVATTWAGYPTPAIIGAAMVWLAVRGWSAPVVSLALAGAVLATTRVRSLFTALVVAVALAGIAALWWWRADTVQHMVLIGAGLVLVVGAWRHILSVMHRGSSSDDPAVLAQLTHVPRLLWTLSFVTVAAASSWLAVGQLFTPTRA